MASALAALKIVHVSEALDLLARYRPKSSDPKPGEDDLRDFAWHYLWRLCHAERLTIHAHGNSAFHVSYSPDGNKLATASKDGTARLWDAQTGRELATLRGHVGDVNTVEFSPDGALVATAGDDRTVRLWNVSPPKVLSTCVADPHHVYSVAFSPDGKTLASAGDEPVVKLWDIAPFREHSHWSAATAPSGLWPFHRMEVSWPQPRETAPASFGTSAPAGPASN